MPLISVLSHLIDIVFVIIMKRKRIFQVAVFIPLAILCVLIIRDRSPYFSPQIYQSIREEPHDGAPLPKKKWKSITQRLSDPGLLTENAKKAEEIRLANWKAEFPWKPTHDPKLEFDPKRHIENRAIGNKSNTDWATRFNHTYLKGFFQNDERFLPQFEKFYRILKEHDRGHNPVMVGRAFWAFRHYHHAAFERDPDEYVLSNGKKVRNGLFSYQTWGDKVPGYHESLRGYLRDWEWLKPDFKTYEGRTNANALIERLVNEIDGMELLPMNVMSNGGRLLEDHPQAQLLLSGEEELLVPYVGWNEESERYWGEQMRQFEKSYAEGDPSLKAAAPELFPPVGFKDGRLVDKDGDPVQWQESTDIVLVNERGERVPVIIEDDGTISLPSPEDVAVMRENGQVQSADFNDLPPEMAEAILKEKAEESP
jgi:hypothetical protein